MRLPVVYPAGPECSVARVDPYVMQWIKRETHLKRPLAIILW